MTRSICRLPFVGVLVWAAFAPAWASAQLARTQPVSPVAPPTLKAPVFDTTSANYPSRGVGDAARTVVAEVDGRPITLGEVADIIKAVPPEQQQKDYQRLFADTLGRLIRVQALVADAQHAGLDSDPVVARRVKAAADDALARQYVLRMTEKRITEQDLLKQYQAAYGGKPGPAEIRLRIIAASTEAEARAALAGVLGGADFAATARRLSQDSSARNGGDLGYMTRESLMPELAGVAFGTAPGQVAPVIISTNGKWVVVKVEDIRNRPPPPFAIAREALLEQIMRVNGSAIADAAMTGKAVHEYSINGKTAESMPSGSTAD